MAEHYMRQYLTLLEETESPTVIDRMIQNESDPLKFKTLRKLQELEKIKPFPVNPFDPSDDTMIGNETGLGFIERGDFDSLDDVDISTDHPVFLKMNNFFRILLPKIERKYGEKITFDNIVAELSFSTGFQNPADYKFKILLSGSLESGYEVSVYYNGSKWTYFVESETE